MQAQVVFGTGNQFSVPVDGTIGNAHVQQYPGLAAYQCKQEIVWRMCASIVDRQHMDPAKRVRMESMSIREVPIAVSFVAPGPMESVCSVPMGITSTGMSIIAASIANRNIRGRVATALQDITNNEDKGYSNARGRRGCFIVRVSWRIRKFFGLFRSGSSA